jgi:hypothetical protein
MTITYTNQITGERTKRENLKDFAAAWALAQEICDEMNWNFDMFCEDVKVKRIF